MDHGRIAWPGPLGGSEAEAGGLHRSGVGAFIVAHALAERPLAALGLPAGASVPVSLAAEADAHVDDLVVGLRGGGRAFIQAKTSIAFGTAKDGRFAREVVAQWVGQFREGIEPSRDRLAVCVDVATKPLLGLGNGLRRRRRIRAGENTSPTPAELTALDTIRSLLSELDSHDLEAVLDAAAVLHLRVSAPGQGDGLAAEHMLEGSVVPIGAGDAAFQALDQRVRKLAADRGELDLAAWVHVLETSGIKLVGEERRSAALQAHAADQAFQRYLETMREAGAQLDLRTLGADLEPISVHEPALALRALASDDEGQASEHSLVQAIQRRGRSLLLGLPGSGKSTALAQIAAHAASREDWPTPILVRLERLAAALPLSDPLDFMIDAAVEGEREADRDAVRTKVAAKVAEGDAILLLDGLDECRERAPHVVLSIAKVLHSAHPDLELVLSTRETAFAAADSLLLPELQLAIPGDLDSTLERLAQHMALERGLEGEGAERWARERLDWVKAITGRDPVLRETPMMPVLLLLLTRQADPEQLPNRRAQVISDVIDDAIARKEVSDRRRDDIEIGVLRGATAKEALSRAFQVLAHALDGISPLPETDALAVLREMLAADFGLAPGSAAGAAADLLHFWDEAGVFVLSAWGTARRLGVRLRLAREIGEARHASALVQAEGDAAAEAWITAHAREDDSETLRLAAGLHVGLASALAGWAARSGEMWALLVAASAIVQGANPEPAMTQGLVDALRDKVVSGGEVSWRATQALVKLPIAQGLRPAVLDEIRSGVPTSHALFAEALAVLAWGLDDEPSLGCLEAVLRAERPPPLSDSGGRTKRGFALATVDRGYSEALVGAADRLLPRRPDLADVVGQAMRRGSSNDETRLWQLLRDTGHDDVVAEENRRMTAEMAGWAAGFARMHHAWGRLMEMIAGLSADPADLTRRQERRLDELADLVSTLEIAQSEGQWLETAVEASEAGVARMIELAATLAELDPTILSAQARLVAGGDEGESYMSFLFDFRHPRELARWDLIPGSEKDAARRDLAAVIGGHPWLRRIAMRALTECPDHEGCITDLLPLVGSARDPLSRELAARLVAWHDQTDVQRFKDWSRSDDPRIRVVAGMMLGRLLATGVAEASDIELLLLDEDRAVRYETAEALAEANIASELADALASARANPAPGWRCAWCDSQNQGNASSCSSCRIVAREPSKAVRALIGRDEDVG